MKSLEITSDLRLQCPRCNSEIPSEGKSLICFTCGASYPIVDHVPILLDTDNPLFSQSNVSSMERSGFNVSWSRRLSRFLPSLGFDMYKKNAESRLPYHLGAETGRCLIVGSGENINQNNFLKKIFEHVVVTDVSLAPEVTHVCDGHALPFVSDQFDCVVLNAVLEHVLEPNIVVEEVARVLKIGGIVVASTPFMQPVHMGAYDFRRFTDLGHRWLFKGFDEIERGPVGAAGSSLAWSLSYFFSSFCSSHRSAKIAKSLSRLCFFWLKYFDYLQSTGKHDAAVGFYFIGRNIKPKTIDPQNLISFYRGIDKEVKKTTTQKP